MTGGHYDLISWDPRGVPSSRPQAHCFDSASEEKKLWADTVFGPGLEARGHFSTQDDVAEFLELSQSADQVLLNFKKKCEQRNIPDTLSYIGTVATVRDMLAINEAYGGAEKINFWGFSHGSLIGLYFVNLFPERVDRVILGGVVDPEYWANKPPHMSWSVTATHIDEILGKFATACIERPKSCEFGKGVKTQAELLSKLKNLLNLAYEHKKVTAKLQNSAPLEFVNLPDPDQWNNLSNALSGIYGKLRSQAVVSGSSVLSRLSPYMWRGSSHNDFTDDTPNYSFQAIICGDAVNQAGVTTKEVFQELMRVAKDVTLILGPARGEGGLYCHQWPYREVERLGSPWKTSLSKLSKPLLILGNTIDPITPYKSAEKVAHALADSTVLVTIPFGGSSNVTALQHIPSWKLSSKW
ncbi:alpha/beta hydrolase family protein [Rhizoctonia solani]|uniref:Alpha/beta hydrolase family protein n=1 Tax=Rhizoctonia solani TaxID=456999 RepID=A0A8H8P168_9AGAM|nr:alpha/beta hydrolase family protein [Rhizoctonia solani]QRW23851.1 alpha/beta hydrolase family protein [Rhizoctonia solani]